MNSFYKFFNYNWFKIIKNNFNNNSIEKISSQDKNRIINFVKKKEICVLVFIVLNFLITYVSESEIYKINYQNYIFFRVLKDNIFTSIIWFIILAILPFITCLFISKKTKSKYYLLLSILYIFSNMFNILLLVYFITAFINNVFLGIVGIINIGLTIFINCKIIMSINDKFLKN